MTHPVFWEIVPPNGAQLTLVGGQSLGNMQLAHAVRISFPATHQKEIADWLRRTADFLSALPQGQSMQVPPPAPLQPVVEQQVPAPMMHYPQAQQAQQAPPPPQPAPMGHNVSLPHAGPAPIGHNNVPLPPAFGGAVQPGGDTVTAGVSVTPATPPIPPDPNFQGGAPRIPMMARPTMGHAPLAARMPSIPNPHEVLGPDNDPFAQMTPGGPAAPVTPPAAQPSAPAPENGPVRHAWDGPYEIGVAKCTRCHITASGVESRYCGQ